jgi:low temperature requirement protein LtrA
MWVTPLITPLEGFVVEPRHFVERHGLVVIVALGESIVVIGAAAGLDLDEGLVLAVLLSLALTAALWWVYFSDEEGAERAMVAAREDRRPRLAVNAFGYWHYGLLLGIVAVAAGLKKAVSNPFDPLGGVIATELGLGTALFLLCEVGYRRTLGIGRGWVRVAAACAAVATIPLGTELDAKAEIGALAAIIALALAIEGYLVRRAEPAPAA